MLLLTYTQKVFYMYQSRLSLPSGSSRKSTQRARQRVFDGVGWGWTEYQMGPFIFLILSEYTD